jgi:plastocyanin
MPRGNAGRDSLHTRADEHTVDVTKDAGRSREFYITTVHIDGKTSTRGDDSHKPEAFPAEKLPAGNGLQLKGPTESGEWTVRAFAFVPSQIVVRQGDRVRLHFVGVQGASHSIHVAGQGVDERFTLRRGTAKTVDLEATTPGVLEIVCDDHGPSMRGELVVLPADAPVP